MKMKKSSLEKITQKYLDITKKIRKENRTIKRNNFDHISNNILSRVVNYNALLEENLESWKEIKSEYYSSLKFLKQYLNLLKKFPKFKTAELSQESGYFSDIPSTYSPEMSNKGIKSGADYYVIEARKRLMEKMMKIKTI